MGGRPRVGVVITQLGIPSEVWMLRQCAAFREIEPVLFGWGFAETAAPIPEGLEHRLFAEPFPEPRGLARRAAGRAGLAWARMPGRAARADIAARLGEAGLDAVLCHFLWTAIPVAEALYGRLPAIGYAHGQDATGLLRLPDYRTAMRRTLPRLAGLVTVGRFQLDNLAPFDPPARRALIPCGAPTALFAARPLPERAAGAPIRFLSVGRVTPEKGQMDSLAAFEAVAREHPQAELVFVGDGPQRAELEAAVARSPAGGRVSVLGWRSEAELARIMVGCHVLLQHSREAAGGWVEGFGVTLTEGGAAGLALVASRSGGIPDQVEDGRNGILFEPGDVDAQAAAMLRLARDEGLRRRLGAAAREVAQGFDSDLMAAKLERFVLEAAGAGAPAEEAAHG
jgi:glycosyltransferase involved in cell wall biosynthesis